MHESNLSNLLPAVTTTTFLCKARRGRDGKIAGDADADVNDIFFNLTIDIFFTLQDF